MLGEGHRDTKPLSRKADAPHPDPMEGSQMGEQVTWDMSLDCQHVSQENVLRS